ncbi:DeoR/GlpR family DNA-binding transcription regulator [Thalassotalea crassostreae]|uniref:DeoR/GlpR family DNA-binding transcription regulator n=1 Tax=Thalassotalea crassostreae TaxID=1763536 RepID=UPI0008389AB7|nr:DeoR family transcriptional regulator [Thalassotalea crassostreae]
MSKRNTQQRRHTILTRLADNGEVTVDELSSFFQTSEVTIRKDLAELEKSGLLLRCYGGAVSLPAEITATSNTEKVSKQKQAIAREAAAQINDHNRIIIDSGRTTAAIVGELNQKKGLVVMTNSLSIANSLQELENEPTLLMTGGTWDSSSEAFQGKVAELVLRSYDFDQLFIGADGIDIERGTTTFNELIGLSQVMSDVARQVVVMVESEKIGRRIPNIELTWQQIDTLITDDGLSVELQNEIKAQGVNLICAQVK